MHRALRIQLFCFAVVVSWVTLFTEATAYSGRSTAANIAVVSNKLIAAAKSGDIAAINALLAKGADINGKDSFGFTALMAAAQNGDTVTVRVLLANGADVNTKTEERKLSPRTALTLASDRGHLETVRLLSQKNYIDAKTEFGNALNYASASGHFEVVKLLLNRVADIKSIKILDISRNALASASEQGHIEIVRLLLTRGGDVNADGQNVVPLIEASRTGHFEIVKLLLANGANVNAKDASGMTALIGASGQISWAPDSTMGYSRQQQTCTLRSWELSPNYLNIIELLLSKGANVNIKENSGYTALMYASTTNQLKVVMLLLDYGADVNVKTDDGETILMAMMQFGGNIDVMKLLLAKGIDIKARDKRGETAFTYALRYACPKEITTVLKQAGSSSRR